MNSYEGGLLNRAINLKKEKFFLNLNIDFKNIYKLYIFLNEKIATKKSVLLFLNGKKNFVPLFSSGYKFEVFNRVKIKESDIEENSLSEKIIKLLSLKNGIIDYKFKIGAVKFIFITQESENEINIEKISDKNLKIKNSHINEKNLTDFFNHKPKNLTITYLNFNYSNNTDRLKILDQEIEFYKSLNAIFSNSFILRVDIGVLIVFSEFSIYPETGAFQIHVNSLLNDINKIDTKIEIKTILSDSDYIKFEELVNFNNENCN